MPDLLAPMEYPIGTITEWSGTLATIPQGWALCDGTNGTPDLHASFLRGAPAGNEAGSTGGEDTHVLTSSEMPPHTHTFSQSAHVHTYNSLSLANTGDSANPFEVDAADTNTSSNSSGISLGNTGGGGAHENRPAFLELAYIMRIF